MAYFSGQKRDCCDHFRVRRVLLIHSFMKPTFSCCDDANRIIHRLHARASVKTAHLMENPDAFRSVARQGRRFDGRRAASKLLDGSEAVQKQHTGGAALVERTLRIKLMKEDLGDR